MFPAQFNLTSLNGKNGFAINGIEGGAMQSTLPMMLDMHQPLIILR